jgi:hypothetical protein
MTPVTIHDHDWRHYQAGNACRTLERIAQLSLQEPLMNKLVCAASLTLLLLTACQKAKPDEMSPRADATASPTSYASTSWTSIAQALFAQVKGLIGPSKQGVASDIFKPVALGKAVLAQEWIIGKKITSTIFHALDNELRADHYGDSLEQPHYVAMRSPDPNTLYVKFRAPANLDIRPMHLHRTKLRFADADHLVQDWFIRDDLRPVHPGKTLSESMCIPSPSTPVGRPCPAPHG